jgi:hypothetical protein
MRCTAGALKNFQEDSLVKNKITRSVPVEDLARSHNYFIIIFKKELAAKFLVIH